MGRMRRQLLVWTVLSLQAETGCGSSPSSWQDSSPSNRPHRRPDYAASDYPREFRGRPPRKDHEADRRRYREDGSPREDRSGYKDGYSYDQEEEDGRRPKAPRPPPLPESDSSSSYTPIHYPFRAADEKDPTTYSRNGYDVQDVPRTELDRPPQLSLFPNENDGEQDDERPFASPRDDIITRYMSNKRKRVMLTLSSGMVGMTIGSFVGKSVMNNPKPFANVFGLVFVLCTFLRNPYGELSRALGMALILALQRTCAIRNKYPAWPHVKACIGAGPRRLTTTSEEYNALYAILSMAMVGFACGGSGAVPLLPAWMGAMAGGATLAFCTTLPTASGDLARTMGMRVVSLVEEVVTINADLKIMSKVGVVSGKILDRVLVLDRKHKIKDKLIRAFSWAYEQVSRTAEQVQTDMRKEEPSSSYNEGTGRNDPRTFRNDEPPREQTRNQPRR